MTVKSRFNGLFKKYIMKTCTKCFIEKDRSEFYQHRSKMLKPTCKVCILKRNKDYRTRRNKQLMMTPEKKEKGYDTYKNEKGVTCIKNFDPYNMGRKGSYIINASTIHASVLPRTSSSDIVKK